MKLPAAPATAPGFCYGLPGAIAPFGNFDPAGVLNGKSLADVYRLREAEMQHGRVVMVACVGFLVVRMPASRESSRVPNKSL